MKISYDREVDALSIVFRETTTTTQHLAEVVMNRSVREALAGKNVNDV